MIISKRIKPIVRRVAWISKQLFVNQLLPSASSSISGSVSKYLGEIATTEPTSPFIFGRTLGVKTVDGAILEGSSNRAWLKVSIRKGLPKEGERTLAIENDPHEVDDFSGEIESGYGKGVKTLMYSGVVTTKVNGNLQAGKANIHFHEADKAGPHWDFVAEGIKPGTKKFEVNIPRGDLRGRYAFISTNRGLLINRMVDNSIRLPKPNYILRKQDFLDNVNNSRYVVETKWDGSLGTCVYKDGRVYFRSHRDTPNEYSDKLPAVEFLYNKSPFIMNRLIYPKPNLNGTVFQGELVHNDGASRVSGILNSYPSAAIKIQELRGPVSYKVWDIQKYKGKDVSKLSYELRRALYVRLVKEIRLVNKNWDVVESMTDKETPFHFYDRITRKCLPEGEGIVIKRRDLSEQSWDKMKMTGFHYMILSKVLPGIGKYSNNVGRILVENPENGALGEVGSLALTDEARSWIWDNKDFLVGKTVKVRCQEVTQRGVCRAGVLYGFHDPEVNLLMTSESIAGGDPSRVKSTMYALKSSSGWKAK